MPVAAPVRLASSAKDQPIVQEGLAEAPVYNALERATIKLYARLRKQLAVRLRAVHVPLATPPHTRTGPARRQLAVEFADSIVNPDLFDEIGFADLDEVGDLQGVIEDLVLDASVGARIAVGFNLPSQTVRKIVDDHLKVVSDMSARLRASVSRWISDAMEQGLSIDDMVDALTSGSPLSEVAAMATARTEAVAAANAGAFGSWRAAAIGGFKQWASAGDERVRPDHVDADGQIVGIDEPFIVCDGQQAMYPGDPSLDAGCRINCRCTLLYRTDAGDQVDLPTNRNDLEALAADRGIDDINSLSNADLRQALLDNADEGDTAAFEVRHDPATGRFLPKGDAGGPAAEHDKSRSVTFSRSYDNTWAPGDKVGRAQFEADVTEAADKVRGVFTSESPFSVSGLSGRVPDAYAFTSTSRTQGTSTLYATTGFWATADARALMGDMLANDPGWLAEGADTPQGILAHELGHAVERRRWAESTDVMAGAAVREARAVVPDWPKGFSRYADEATVLGDPAEAVAEAIAHVAMGGHDRGAAAVVRFVVENDGRDKVLVRPRAAAAIEQFDVRHDPATGRFLPKGDAGGQPGDKNDAPILVHDVDQAIELLAEGKEVELDQPHEIATLIDRLAQIGDDAVAKGDKAPIYNLCDVTVEGTNLFCAGNQGVDRVQMPQLKGDPAPGSWADLNLERDSRGEVDLTGAYKDHLLERGVVVTDDEENPAYLRATQNELNGVKVAQIARAMEQGTVLEGAIWVSRDNYVLDGHHRWAAQVALQYAEAGRVQPIAVHRADIGIIEMLNDTWSFANDRGLAPKPITQDIPVTVTGAELFDGWYLALSGVEIVAGPYPSEAAAVADMARFDGYSHLRAHLLADLAGGYIDSRPAFEVRHDPATGRFLPKGDAGGEPADKNRAIGVTNDQRSLIQKVSGKLPGESDVDYHDRVFVEGQERYAPVDDIELECVEIRSDEGVPQVEFKDWTSIEAPYERLVETADAFAAAKSDPSDSAVRAAYADLVAQTNVQWDHLTSPESEGGQGINVEFLTREEIQGRGLDPLGLNPYKTAGDQADDLRDNNHLMIASLSSYPEAAHPILDSELGGEYDRFRAVHDAYGHAAVGADFTRHGEYQAWLHHSSMFTGPARLAASTELTGENSYLVTRHEAAPHKAALLPENLVAMPWDRDGNYMPDFWKRKAAAAMRLLRRRFATERPVVDGPLLSEFVGYPVPDPEMATGSDLARLDNAYARYGVVNPCDALHGAVLLERIQNGEVDPMTLQAAIGAGLVAAAGDGISGAMVAAAPSTATAPAVDDNVALPHVTLCYLGKDATLIDDTQRALVDAFVALVAADEAPLTATVAGVGVMGTDNAVVLLLNCCALSEAHDEIQAGLETAGLCPPWSHDGFIVHLSLEYPDDVAASIVAAQTLVGTEIVFDALVTVYGGEEHRFPFAGAPPESEPAVELVADRGVFARSR